MTASQPPAGSVILFGWMRFPSEESGSPVEAARLAHGLTDKALAELAGVSESTLYRAKAGKLVSPRLAQQIEMALGLPPGAIRTRQGRPVPLLDERIDQMEQRLDVLEAQLLEVRRLLRGDHGSSPTRAG